METKDSAEVEGGTSMIVGGEELDNQFNRRILPHNNPRLQGKPVSGELNHNGKG